jgi:hypothetical protein
MKKNNTHRNANHWFLGVLLGLLASTLPAGAFYNPHTGRWLSRDPAGERAEHNLHGFVENDSVASYDVLGRERAPNVDRFYYNDQPVGVTATVTLDGASLCNRGRIDFGVVFTYSDDDDDRYARRAFFAFDAQPVLAIYAYNGDDRLVSISGCYTHYLSAVCPSVRQVGVTGFDSWYSDEERGELNYVWGVQMYWQYKCNPCCELEEPLTATFSFVYGPLTDPIPPPSPGGGRALTPAIAPNRLSIGR